MFRIEVHRYIRYILAFFYRVGFWHRQDVETLGRRAIKSLYLIYNFIFLISLAAATVSSDNMDEKIFSAEASIVAVVLFVKLLHIIWRKAAILELLNGICEYNVDDRETFIAVSHKLNIFMKLMRAFICAMYFCDFVILLVAPFIGSGRNLFVNIALPLDWENDELSYWIAFVFICTEVGISVTSLLFSVIMWYLMANCGWRYGALGSQLKAMGEIQVVFDESGNEVRVSDAEKDAVYRRDLVKAMASHNQLKELTNQLDSFLSKIFGVQLTTSGICICASIYNISFMRGDNLVKFYMYTMSLVYNIFDIFMIMFFGNEITLASDRLSYHLYESDWIDRSQSIKKDVLIFGEFLMQPQQLMILKIYPLTLETFSRILNSAYSMFNILKNFK